MRPVAGASALVGVLVLSGGLAGALHSVSPEGFSGVGAAPATARSGSPSEPSVVPYQATAPAWTCGPGPQRLSDMEVTEEGYRKASRGDASRPHQFYLARAMYSGTRGGGFGFRRRGGDYLGDRGPAWSIDYPNADRVMTRVATRLSNLDACEWEMPISLADPDLRKYPFLYSLEWGYADLTEAEVAGLRDYLLAGGFLMLDDFWGSREWRSFREQMRRVLPDHAIVDVPRDHAIFRSYYELDEEILQVPNVGSGRAVAMGVPGATTSEQDGHEAHLRGIFDENGRLIVAINWNTDLGDALEWAESPRYPLEYSTFASRLFLNLIVYAMAY
ncbi:MAG: DUF4159 domain-containing protein [Gemmatimonadota bacterium]|nr:DUF4159 domain-containing protein [Gemmatimonadota bacterium]